MPMTRSLTCETNPMDDIADLTDSSDFPFSR